MATLFIVLTTPAKISRTSSTVLPWIWWANCFLRPSVNGIRLVFHSRIFFQLFFNDHSPWKPTIFAEVGSEKFSLKSKRDQKSGTRASKLTWSLTSVSLVLLPPQHTSSLSEGRFWSSSELSLPSWPLPHDVDSWQLLLLPNRPNYFHFAGTEASVFSVLLRCFCFDPASHRDTRLRHYVR